MSITQTNAVSNGWKIPRDMEGLAEVKTLLAEIFHLPSRHGELFDLAKRLHSIQRYRAAIDAGTTFLKLLNDHHSLQKRPQLRAMRFEAIILVAQSMSEAADLKVGLGILDDEFWTIIDEIEQVVAAQNDESVYSLVSNWDMIIDDMKFLPRLMQERIDLMVRHGISDEAKRFAALAYQIERAMILPRRSRSDESDWYVHQLSRGPRILEALRGAGVLPEKRN